MMTNEWGVTLVEFIHSHYDVFTDHAENAGFTKPRKGDRIKMFYIYKRWLTKHRDFIISLIRKGQIDDLRQPIKWFFEESQDYDNHKWLRSQL
jgi:hypothetical protein